MILGVGVDVCEVARIRRALEGATGARFRARVYTAAEQAYCEARRRTRFASYAARFAAKEAAMKALGTGMRGVAFREIAVAREPGGPPRLALLGRARARAESLGVSAAHVTITHGRRDAAATTDWLPTDPKHPAPSRSLRDPLTQVLADSGRLGSSRFAARRHS